MLDKKNCPFCKSEAVVTRYHGNKAMFYACPICGRFEINSISDKWIFNNNKIRPYLFYHCIKQDSSDREYYVFNSDMSKEDNSVLINEEIVENWYPKTLDEKIYLVLSYVNKQTRTHGEIVVLNYRECLSLFFIDRWGFDKKQKKFYELSFDFNNMDMDYITEYLLRTGYVQVERIKSETIKDSQDIIVQITPEGYKKIEKRKDIKLPDIFLNGENNDILTKMLFSYCNTENKGNIETKKSILTKIGNDLEGRARELQTINSGLKSEIFFGLNNFNIRHNNVADNTNSYRKEIAKSTEKEIELLYDALFGKCVIAYIHLFYKDCFNKYNDVKNIMSNKGDNKQ